MADSDMHTPYVPALLLPSIGGDGRRLAADGAAAGQAYAALQMQQEHHHLPHDSANSSLAATASSGGLSHPHTASAAAQQQQQQQQQQALQNALASTAVAGGRRGGGERSVVTPSASSELGRAHTHKHTGVFSTHHSQKQIQAQLKAAAAMRHMDGLAAGAASMAQQATVLRAQMEQEQRAAAQLQHEVHDLEAQLAQAQAPSSAPAKSGTAALSLMERRTRMFALQQSLVHAKERVATQADVVARAARAFEQADLAHDRYAGELAKLETLQTLLRQRQDEEHLQLSLLAQASEKHNARLRARAAAKASRDQEQHAREEAEEAAQELANHLRAEEGRARHAEEMRGVAAQIAERERALNQMLSEALKAREDSILALKASTAAAHNDLLAQNARRRRRIEAREEARAHERKELEGAGRNADAIFAARDEQARQQTKAQRIAAEQAVRAERLRAQMETEGVQVQKADMAALRDAAVLVDYKRKMGHSVIDTTAAALAASRARREEKRRNDEALLVAQMDARRFVPDDASEVDEDEEQTEQRNAQHKFAGQGVALQNFLAVEHGEDSSAAAHAAAAAAGDSSDDDTGGAAPSDRASSQLLSPAEELAAWKRANPDPDAEYNAWGLRVIPNHQSIYRKRLDARKIALSLQAARDKLARGKQLVVCGKTYDHCSKFLSDPVVVLFKDFTVGVPMTQTVKLTNVSFAFNHFKLLPLADSVADFFSIAYVPVGRMSAGSVAAMEVTFAPKVNEDLDTVIPFLAETGPFAIQLQARTKKAVISVAPFPLLDMGVCVLGDSCSASFKITNGGAIPVDFVVEHVRKRRPEKTQDDARVELVGEEKEQPPHGQQQRPQTQPAPSVGGAAADVKPLNLTGLVPVSSSAAAAAGGASASAVPFSSTSVLFPDRIPVVDSGADVTAAAAASTVSEISNPPDWHRSAADAALEAAAHAEELEYDMDSYLRYAPGGRVEAYASTHLRFDFTPRVDGAWVHSFVLRFGPQQYAKGQKPLQWGSPKDFEVQVTGEGSKVPIYLEDDLLDFQTVCFGKLYRAEIVLRNRASTAHKIHMRLPQRLGLHAPPLDKCIEFSPSVGYISRYDTLRVQVKLIPSKALWRALRATTLPSSPNGSAIDAAQYAIGHAFLPMLIEVADQTLPVEWALTARMVEPNLAVTISTPGQEKEQQQSADEDGDGESDSNPPIPTLNFGSVYTTESKVIPVTFTNRSPLLQKFCFMNLRPEVRLLDASLGGGGSAVRDDIATFFLPPFRSLVVNVSFAPSSAIEYEFEQEVLTHLGQHIRLPIKARGAKPLLGLQHTSITFEATPNFADSFQPNVLTNLSQLHRHTVQLVLDEPSEESDAVAQSIHSARSFVSFYPSCFQLGPAPPEAKPTDAPSGSTSPSGRNRGVKTATNAATQRVEVRFRPWLCLDELYANVGLGATQSLQQQQQNDAAAEDGGTINEHEGDEKHDGDGGDHEEKGVSSSPRMAPKKPAPAPAAGSSKKKSRKQTAEQEAELARKLAAEAELKRLEEEKAALAAREAAEAAARAAAAQEEFNSRAALEQRERIQPSNPLPQPHFVQFSDRLQLQVIDARARLEAANERLEQLDRERNLDEDEEEEEEEDDDDAEEERESDDEQDRERGEDEEKQSFAGSSLPTSKALSKKSSMSSLAAPKRTVSEPFSRHARHRVAVHLRSEHIHTGEISYRVQWMEVRTTLVLPLLQVRPRFVDFGQVPLGQARTQSFEVRNTAPPDGRSVQLVSDALGFSSHFTVLSALRRLAPGEIQIVVVEFRPRREGKNFKQDLVLRSEAHRNVQVVVPLLGLCISPDLQIILPPAALAPTAAAAAGANDNAKPTVPALSRLADGSEVQLLHFGDCIAGETIVRHIVVRNHSVYPYTYTVTQQEPSDTDAHPNHVHGSPASVSASAHNVGAGGASSEFFVVPATGTIPAQGGAVTLAVHFAPRVPSTLFPFQTLLRVGNKRLHVQAEAHERQVFVSGGRALRSAAAAVSAQPQQPQQQQQQQPAASASVAAAVQSASFQSRSLVSGLTVLAPNLCFPNPLAFLDGLMPTLSAGVGGATTAAAFPLLMSADESPALWERVPVLAEEQTAIGGGAAAGSSGAGRAGGSAADERKKRPNKDAGGAGAGKKADATGASGTGGSGSAKKDLASARGRSAGSRDLSSAGGIGAAGVPASAAAAVPETYDASLASNRLVELTFDANRIMDLSASAVGGPPAASSSKGKKGAASAAAAENTPALFLVETVQIGAALSSSQQQNASSEGGKGAGAGAEKDKDGAGGAGSYSITLHPARELDKKSSAASSSSSSSSSNSSLSGEGALSLFSVSSPSGVLRPGVRDSVRFLFDWGRYMSSKNLDPERRVLAGVGQWIEAAARISIKGGITPAHLPQQQTIDVKLRVYVD